MSESPAEIYTGLRGQALELGTVELDGVPPGVGVVAALLETAYPQAVATLVGVADGSTSLYFSSGGGIIGAGQHEAVAAATARWLQACLASVELLAPVVEPPPPGLGTTQLVAVTREGLLGATAPERDLGEGRHPLSPLFYAAQDVITQVRIVEAG